MKIKNTYKPVKIHRYFSAKEFINLVEHNPSIIVNSRIIPPKLGSKNLNSSFKVELDLAY